MTHPNREELAREYAAKRYAHTDIESKYAAITAHEDGQGVGEERGFMRAVEMLRGGGIAHFPREWRTLCGDWLEQQSKERGE